MCVVGLFGLVFAFVLFWFLSVYVLCVAMLRILVVALLRWVFGGWFGVFSSIAGWSAAGGFVEFGGLGGGV